MASDLFFATLNGQSYSDLYRKILSLDRSVTSFHDRLRNVKKLLGDKSYIVKYFSDYYDPHLSKMNHLSDHNNICHLVEMLANYLLMTDEVKKIDGREKTYYIDSNRLNRRDRPNDIQEQNGKNNSMVVQFNNQNYKKDKKVKIYKRDFDNSYCGRVLQDQQNGIDEATYKLHHHLGNQYKLSNMKHDLHFDQITTKTLLDGYFDLDDIHADSSADDYYATLADPQVVKYMLPLTHNHAIHKSVTWLLWIELKNLLPKVNLSKSQYFVIGLYSLGYTYRDIANKYRNNNGKLHPVSEQYINKLLNKLFHKIAKTYYKICLKKISNSKEWYV